MVPFDMLLTDEQKRMFAEGESMIQEGERMIQEILHTLSFHLPISERGSFLHLVNMLCEQSCRIGRIKQTIEQIRIMKIYHHAEETQKKEPATLAQTGKAPAAEPFAQAVLYGYAEDHGIL